MGDLLNSAQGLAHRAGTERGRRSIGDWEAVIQMDGSSERCHVVVQSGELHVHPGPHPGPTAVLAGDDASLCDGLSGLVDFTHLVADARSVVAGNYFDMINLGRVATATKQRPAVHP